MTIGSYFDLEETKLMLNVKVSDTVEDTLILQFGDAGNVQVQNILSPFAKNLPVTDTDLLISLKKAANYWAASLYKQHDDQDIPAKSFLGMYKTVSDGIIIAMKALQTNTGAKVFFKTAGNQASVTI